MKPPISYLKRLVRLKLASARRLQGLSDHRSAILSRAWPVAFPFVIQLISNSQKAASSLWSLKLANSEPQPDSCHVYRSDGRDWSYSILDRTRMAQGPKLVGGLRAEKPKKLPTPWWTNSSTLILVLRGLTAWWNPSGTSCGPH